MVGRGEQMPIVVAPSAEALPSSCGMPLVAVLPIQLRANGDDLGFLAEDLTEDITRELGQSLYCKVIAASTIAARRDRTADHRALQHELGARYAVEARLQKAGESLRLTVQLIEAGSDSSLWSSRFAAKVSEIEESSEQFALPIAIELDQTISRIELARAQAKRPPCSAWEHVLRSLAAPVDKGSGLGSNSQAIEEARCAISIAPDYALAHAMLAKTLAARTQTDRLSLSAEDRSSVVQEAHRAINRAIALDNNNAIVLIRLADAYAQLGDAEAGLRLAQRAATLAPNSAEALYTLGFTNFMLGKTMETIDAIDRQDRIGIADNMRAGGQSMLGICLFIEGRTAEAEAAVDIALAIQPNYYVALRWKAIVAAELGKEQSAKATIKLLRSLEPGRSIEDYLDSPRHLPVEHPRKYEAIEILRRLLEETEGMA
jgi:adenylate cyclase